MRLAVRVALKPVLLLTLATGTVLFFSHGLRSLVLDMYLIALAGVLLHALTRAERAIAGGNRRSAYADALAAMQPRAPVPPELALQRDVELSRVNGFHFHVRLRPVLREIAAHRLRTMYGVELDREPLRARELVPAAAWEVIDPDRPLPEDRLAPGPEVSRLRTVVDELERI